MTTITRLEICVLTLTPLALKSIGTSESITETETEK